MFDCLQENLPMDETQISYGFSQQEWENCLKVLEVLKKNPLQNPDNEHFGTLITKIYKTAKKQIKQSAAMQRKKADEETTHQTSIVKNALNNTTLFQAEEPSERDAFAPLQTPRNCYSCNQVYDQMHFFYHRLCPTCATQSYRYRHITTDLSQRKVILTGGRVKIGYATTLKLLRSQAHVTITTRFPAIALQQLQQEKDYGTWKTNLEIYGLDLRNLSAVSDFIEYYHRKHQSLDILINNAAQTIQYPGQYYAPLIAQEKQLAANQASIPFLTLNPTPVTEETKALTQSFASTNYVKNRFGQPVDQRDKNSWNATLAEVPVQELLAANLINHIAPYMLIKGLTPLLKASAFQDKFIVNVTSSEGQFSYSNKTMFHPHTNMTKAALNMLTRTSAHEYAQYHIWINCVDVGWVSTGAKETLRQKQFEAGQIPPLDPVDGAARIMHPLHEIIHKQHSFFGHLLKNFQIAEW